MNNHSMFQSSGNNQLNNSGGNNMQGGGSSNRLNSSSPGSSPSGNNNFTVPSGIGYDAYQGSIQQILRDNIGEYMDVEF